MSYGYTKQTDLGFLEAKEKVVSALQEQGFGILTEIDVKSTLKKKLDVDYSNYLILGACNPPFAHQALLAEQEIGLLLPCNVIIYEKDDKTFVSAVKPSVAMQMIDNAKLMTIATEVEKRLVEAIDAL